MSALTPSSSRSARIRSGSPSSPMCRSVTIRTRLSPSRRASYAISSVAPSPNLIGDASITNTVSVGRVTPFMGFVSYLIAAPRSLAAPRPAGPQPRDGPAARATCARIIIGPVSRSPLPAPGSPPGTKFGALQHRDYRRYFILVLLSATADNIEHVISYWVIFQAFHSPMLAGFAVISHWVPFLLFSVYAGALADRFDCRKLIQISQGLFALASLAWAVLFMTGTLR